MTEDTSLSTLPLASLKIRKSLLEAGIYDTQSAMAKAKALSENINDPDILEKLTQQHFDFAATLKQQVSNLTNVEATLSSVQPVNSERNFLLIEKPQYNDMFGSRASQWNTPSSAEHNHNVLAGMMGIRKDYSSGSTGELGYTYDLNYNIVPQKIDLSAHPSDYASLFYKKETANRDTTNNYVYSPMLYCVTALKNTNNVDTSVTLSVRGSSYSTYSGLGINVFQPDSPDDSQVTSYDFGNLRSYVSNSASVSQATPHIIPAGQTDIVVFYAGSHYENDSYFYEFLRWMGLYNIDGMFPDGVITNNTVLNNLSCIGREHKINNFHEVWSYNPNA